MTRKLAGFGLVAVLIAAFLVVMPTPSARAAEAPPVFALKWGNVGTDTGQFNQPRGVAVDSDGNVYVADSNNNRIQKFSATGGFLAAWGTQGSGEGHFNGPQGVAVDSDDDVYVADAGNHRVQRFSATGTFERAWGTNGTGTGQFDTPQGVAVDSDGDVYVADTFNNRIQKFTSTGTFVTTWGSSGSGDAQFGQPRGVAVDDSGDVYVADYYNSAVKKFTSTGTFVAQWGTFGGGTGQFVGPQGVVVDSDGNVYVVDTFNNRIQKSTNTGTFLTAWGTEGTSDGQFKNPYGVAVDSAGSIYVADAVNYRVQKFEYRIDGTDPTVTVTTPAEGAVYACNQAVVADFSCTDEVGGSGIATCVGTVPDGSSVNTATLGDHDFTVTATDNAANTASVTRSYTVVAPRPDGHIKKGSGPFIGDDIYNTTGLDQTQSGSAPRRSSVTYTVKVQNDSQVTDRLRLKGTGSNTAFVVTYTVGGADVTPAVVAGTYRTPALAPGASLSVKVVVKVKGTAPAGSRLSATLTAKSNTDTTYKDTVKFVTSRA